MGYCIRPKDIDACRPARDQDRPACLDNMNSSSDSHLKGRGDRRFHDNAWVEIVVARCSASSVEWF